MKKEVKIQDHILVPKHNLLSEDEINKLLIQYNITRKQMPKISSKDPSLQGIEIKKGDIVLVKASRAIGLDKVVEEIRQI